jgi:hypothetical protein
MRLYYEILDDFKMYSLSDHLFRRTIELFLLAGEKNEKGRLPPPHEIAWRLRASPDDMMKDMLALRDVKILSQIGDEWIVTNYEKRQKPMPKKEYMKRKREEDVEYRQQEREWKATPTTEKESNNMDFSNKPKSKCEEAFDKILTGLLLQDAGKKLIERLETCEIDDDGDTLLVIPKSSDDAEWLQARGSKILNNNIQGINDYERVVIVG